MTTDPLQTFLLLAFGSTIVALLTTGLTSGLTALAAVVSWIGVIVAMFDR